MTGWRGTVLLAALVLAACTGGGGETTGTAGTSGDTGTTTGTTTGSTSTGPTGPVVPDAVGLGLAEAKAASAEVGIRTVVVGKKFSAEPKLTVLRQSPPAGTGLDGARQLQVTVAVKPHVPRLEGLPFNVAKRLLRDQELRLGNVVKRASTELENTVLIQRVHAGRTLDPGERVALVIVDPHVCGSPLNPWCYSVLGGSGVIYNPPFRLCDYLNCITSFWDSTNGYVIQCADGEFSHSGGVSGSCSSHGGNGRALYRP